MGGRAGGGWARGHRSVAVENKTGWEVRIKGWKRKRERRKKKEERASEAGENMTMEIRRREEGEVMEREERK